MGEERVGKIDRPREEASIERLVEQRRRADTRTRLDGASMNPIQVDDDKLKRLELALDSLRAGLALMSQPTDKAEVDEVGGDKVLAVPQLNPVEWLMGVLSDNALLAESRRIHALMAAGESWL